jgi:predicted DNA binding CopG/RHH family protein
LATSQKWEVFLFNNKKDLKKFVLVKNSLYVCFMKKQIQSYISEEDYSKLKLIAEKDGLLFATLIRQIIVNYLKTKKVK